MPVLDANTVDFTSSSPEQTQRMAARMGPAAINGGAGIQSPLRGLMRSCHPNDIIRCPEGASCSSAGIYARGTDGYTQSSPTWVRSPWFRRPSRPHPAAMNCGARIPSPLTRAKNLPSMRPCPRVLCGGIVFQRGHLCPRESQGDNYFIGVST